MESFTCCLTNSAQCQVDVLETGYLDPHILDLRPTWM